MAIIYLFLQLPAGLKLPTQYLGRAALKRYYMWHFSMQGLPAIDVAIESCELLPHIFTFSPCGVVIFCGTISWLFPTSRLFTGALLCAARTFLPLRDPSTTLRTIAGL